MPEVIENKESLFLTESKKSSVESVVSDPVKVSIADLCAKGKVQYALKNYEQAADLYSRATEQQAELNGEMNPDNADILFLYGQSLFKLGQSKSDVLGGGAALTRKKPGSSKPALTSGIKEITEVEDKPSIDDKISSLPIRNDVLKRDEQNPLSDSKKPFFQFTGDEYFEESDEDVKENQSGNDEDEDEEDDLAAAFDVLDLARILLEKKLELLKNVDDKDEKIGNSPMINHYKERLADTHDLLAEISLENERFSAAVTDCRAALGYKKELYTEERSIIAEAHFKLSLALEFASITSTADEKAKTEGTLELDQSLRDEAVKEMEAAIRSTELKLKVKEAEISSNDSLTETETTRHQITEVKDMISELKSRLEELRGPAIDVKSILFGKLTEGNRTLNNNNLDNKSPIDAAARVEETKKNAIDVSGLVRKKPKAVEISDANGLAEKRKAEDNEEAESKRAKIENVNNDNTPIGT